MPLQRNLPLKRLRKQQEQQQQQQPQKSKNENFTAKTQYNNLKAPSNNVKLQSEKTLTTHFFF